MSIVLCLWSASLSQTLFGCFSALGAEWALPHTGFSIFHLGLGCFLILLLGLDIRKADWKGLHLCHTCKWQNCPGPEQVVFFRTVIWTPDSTGWTGTAPALAVDHTPGLMHSSRLLSPPLWQASLLKSVSPTSCPFACTLFRI